MSLYSDKIREATEQAIETLSKRGTIDKTVFWLGNTRQVTRIPNDVKSEFLANRAFGDWAEELIRSSINNEQNMFTAVKYGNSEKILAGEEGFKEFYLNQKDDVKKWGKRPDLLVYNRGEEPFLDMSPHRTELMVENVKKSLFSMEVRSSKMLALEYIRVKEERKKGKSLSHHDFPSITIKIEDLKVVYDWLCIHDTPQYYVQVFLDSVYVIDFLKILNILANGKHYRVIRSKNSQNKPTIMVPISFATRVDTGFTLPEFEVAMRYNSLGRLDTYVKPSGGSVDLDLTSVLNDISAWKKE